MATKHTMSSLCRTCRRKLFTPPTRSLSTTTSPNAPPPSTANSSSSGTPSSDETFSKLFADLKQSTPSSSVSSIFDSARHEAMVRPASMTSPNEPYHLNVYAHKHNMHITFTEPSRNPILSFSCGQIGLRKAQRGSFDAAYQLSTYTMRKLVMAQWRHGGKKITTNPMKTLKDVGNGKDTGTGIEVIMRGHGPGREAFQKALLGQEGSLIKPLIVKVTDGTRLKFGGTRSPAVRRLG